MELEQHVLKIRMMWRQGMNGGWGYCRITYGVSRQHDKRRSTGAKDTVQPPGIATVPRISEKPSI